MPIAFWLVAALLAQQPASSSNASSLNFEVFKAQVQPIFLEKREGHTRCVTCHSIGNVVFLQELSPGATTWNEEQSRRNFEAVSKLVIPGEPMKSKLLLHPLEPAAGGDEFHNGGRQFASRDDARFRAIAAWVRGQAASGSGR